MEFGKSNQNLTWNIQNTVFVAGIGGLGKGKQFCHLRLGKIFVLSQIADSLIHFSSPVPSYIMRKLHIDIYAKIA